MSKPRTSDLDWRKLHTNITHVSLTCFDTMGKVIQDSDDEGDLSEPSPQRLTDDNLVAMAPPAVIEGLATSTNVSVPSVNGTSSSGPHYSSPLVLLTLTLSTRIEAAARDA